MLRTGPRSVVVGAGGEMGESVAGPRPAAGGVGSEGEVVGSVSGVLLAPAVVSASASASEGCAAERVFISTSAAEEAGRFSFEGVDASGP